MPASVDESYRFLAAKYVRRQAKQLAEQLEGVRAAEDVEFVHRARVASRRLRAAMRMFRDCFDAQQWKRWRRHLRRVTAGMGDARDKDVQIVFLHEVLHGLKEWRLVYMGGWDWSGGALRRPSHKTIAILVKWGLIEGDDEMRLTELGRKV